MNNENLRSLADLTTEEKREIGKKGGKASVEARRKKKMLKECLEILMQKDAGRDSNGKPITAVEAMSIAAMKGAMNGDWKAWELVRDTVGQKPVDKVMISEVDQNVIDDVERIVEESLNDE